MSFLIIGGLVVAGLSAFIALRGPSYRGRERRWSSSGGRWHSQ
jgi:hypothetical protein